MKIADLFVRLGLKSRDYEQGIDKAQKKTSAFSKGIKRIGGLIAGAFAVGQIVSFTKEIIKLGGEAEGVRTAFNRIANDQVLRDLQEATAGTVSQLELMKRTVTAFNLGLPVENLASLFEFATKRAQETGESVDYLVNSIVTGIGRKSPLILDNLGISAVQLREKLEGVGIGTATTAEVAAAVGEIAAESMRESGKIIDTNAVKLQNLTAMWQDTKLAIAENKAIIDSVGDSLSKLQKMLFVWGAESATAWEKASISVDIFDRSAEKTYQRVFKREQELARVRDAGADMAASNAAAIKLARDKEAKSVVTVSDRIKELETQLSETRKLLSPSTELSIFEQAIEDVNKLESELKKLKDALPKSLVPRAGGMPEMTGQAGTPQIGGEAPLPGGLADMSGFLAKNNAYSRQLMDESLADWQYFKQQMAMMVADFSIDVVSEFGEAMGEMFKTGEFPANFGDDILAMLGKFLSGLGKMLIMFGLGSQAFQSLIDSAFTNPASAIAAIAVGGALVALGSGISGYVGAGPGGAGGGASSGGQRIFDASDFPTGEKGMNINVEGVLQGDNILISNQRSGYRRRVVG